MAKKKKSEKADEIIKNHVWFSTIPGWLPIPLLDLAAVTAVQIDMIKQLCELYDKKYDSQRGKAVVLALFNTIGGRLPAYAIRSSLKSIPLIGWALGGASLALFAGASTYATGLVFKEHFDKGGTLKEMNPETFKEFYMKQFMKGKEVVEEVVEDMKKKEEEE
jgi:uncharacterized protein (DUF697 family)